MDSFITMPYILLLWSFLYVTGILFDNSSISELVFNVFLGQGLGFCFNSLNRWFAHLGHNVVREQTHVPHTTRITYHAYHVPSALRTTYHVYHLLHVPRTTGTRNIEHVFGPGPGVLFLSLGRWFAHPDSSGE